MPETYYEIYTDGGCRPNPGIGSWAYVAVQRCDGRADVVLDSSSAVNIDATNNIMELTAAIKGVAYAKKKFTNKERVCIVTDSQYVKNGITEWVKKWEANNWRNSGGQVANVDLWKTLLLLTSNFKVEWRWIRGHCGNVHNEECDQLCSRAIARVVDQMEKELRGA